MKVQDLRINYSSLTRSAQMTIRDEEDLQFNLFFIPFCAATIFAKYVM